MTSCIEAQTSTENYQTLKYKYQVNIYKEAPKNNPYFIVWHWGNPRQLSTQAALESDIFDLK